MSGVRENRMHRSTGGGWKRSACHGHRRWAPGGNPGDERRAYRIFATAPAPHPTNSYLVGEGRHVLSGVPLSRQADKISAHAYVSSCLEHLAIQR